MRTFSAKQLWQMLYIDPEHLEVDASTHVDIALEEAFLHRNREWVDTAVGLLINDEETIVPDTVTDHSLDLDLADPAIREAYNALRELQGLEPVAPPEPEVQPLAGILEAAQVTIEHSPDGKYSMAVSDDGSWSSAGLRTDVEAEVRAYAESVQTVSPDQDDEDDVIDGILAILGDTLPAWALKALGEANAERKPKPRCEAHNVFARESDGKCARCDEEALAGTDEVTEHLVALLARAGVDLGAPAKVTQQPQAKAKAKNATPVRVAFTNNGNGRIARRSCHEVRNAFSDQLVDENVFSWRDLTREQVIARLEALDVPYVEVPVAELEG